MNKTSMFLLFLFSTTMSWSAAPLEKMSAKFKFPTDDEVRISQLPINKIEMPAKSFEGNMVRYESSKNTWVESIYNSGKEEWRPLCWVETVIGTKGVPAYYLPGNPMDNEHVGTLLVITNQGYAVEMTGPDYGSSFARLKKSLSTFELPPEISTKTAVCDPSWHRYDFSRIFNRQ